MIGFNPHTRRLGLPVPTRRDARVAPTCQSGSAGDDRRERNLVPVNSSSRTAERPAARAHTPASSAARSASSALSLQCDAPAPRRGLRADAVERRRYRESYEAAGRPTAPAPRPKLVRSA